METFKLIHTADWHLGYSLGRHDRRPDMLAALDGLIRLAEGIQPDAILHAGDVFHHERPSTATLADAAGNHDGRRLLEVVGALAAEREPARIRIRTTPGTIRIAPKGDRPGAVVSVLPWITPAESMRAATESEQRGNDERRHGRFVEAAARTAGDAARTLAAEEAGPNGPPPVLLLAHTYLAGATAGGSERKISVRPETASRAGLFPETAYAACGHIHDRQVIHGAAPRIGPEAQAEPRRAIYCGSLIQMDFGERLQEKSVEVVTLARNAQDGAWHVAEAERVALPRARRLVDWRGDWTALEQLARDGGLSDAILRAHIESDERLHDIAERVAQIAPTCLLHEVVNIVTNPRARGAEAKDFAEEPEAPIAEQYRDWRRERGGQSRVPDETAAAVFEAAMAAAGPDPPPDPFGVKALEKRFTDIMQNLQAARR